jgi:homocysteine S-methyltransferase
MNTSRDNLPQLSGDIFLTDGGIETTLIFHNGFDLPYFASFDLLKTQLGRDALIKYYETYAAMAVHAKQALFWKAQPGVQTQTGPIN